MSETGILAFVHFHDPSLRRIQRRQRLWAVLHHGRGRIGRAFNAGISMLIVVSVALIPLEWIDGFDGYIVAVQALEAAIIGVFTVEYLLRLYAAPRRGKYALSFWGIVDLLSIVPFYAGLFGNDYVRMLRLIRFFKLGEVEPSAQSDEGRSLKHGIGLLPNETITYVATKHPLVLLLGSIPCIIFVTAAFATVIAMEGDPIGIAIGVALLLFAFVLFWRTWLDYSYDVMYVTSMRLIFQNQHLLGRSANQVGYGSITNVKPQYAGVFSYIFRYGTLVVDTAAESPGQIGMHMVRNHEKAAHAIMQEMGAHGHVGSLEID